MKNFFKKMDASEIIAVVFFSLLVALYVCVFSSPVKCTTISANESTTQTSATPVKQIVNIAPLNR